MPSPTTRIRAQKQDPGGNLNTWGALLNTTGLDLVDEAIAGVETIALTGANVTLTSTNYATDEARNFGLRFTGTGGCTVTIPSVEKVYAARNDTDGNVTIKTTGGAGVTIGAGAGAVIQCDGTDCRLAGRTDFEPSVAAAFSATSTTSLAIGTGAKTFALVETDRAFAVGMRVRAADSAAPATNYMDGTVTSYSGTTLAVTIDATAGSGTIASWTVSFAQAQIGLPSQSGNSGRFLTTDGTTASWALAIPSQPGNAGRYLTTDGTTASWVAAPVAPLTTVNVTATTRTFLSTDTDKIIDFTGSSDSTWTLPAAATLGSGWYTRIRNNGAAAIEIVTNAGSNLVVNGDFASGTSWTAGSGWSIGAGVATATTASGTLTQSVALTAGVIYKLIYTQTYSAGDLQPSFTGGTTVQDQAERIAGTFTRYITAVSGNNTLRFVSNGGSFTGTLDNVSLAAVEAIDGRGSIWVYPGESFLLQCDGTSFRTVGRMRGGVWVPITVTEVTSSVSTVDFSRGFSDREIRSMKIIGNQVSDSSTGVIGLRYRDSGGSYVTTGANSNRTNFSMSGTTWTSTAVTGGAGSQIDFFDGTGNGGSFELTIGTIRSLSGSASTTGPVHFVGQGDTGNAAFGFGAQGFNGGYCSGIRLNITSGTIEPNSRFVLYGLRN
jgi:hypothetical protein